MTGGRRRRWLILAVIVLAQTMANVGYRGPWIGLAIVMLAGLALLALVREKSRF